METRICKPKVCGSLHKDFPVPGLYHEFHIHFALLIILIFFSGIGTGNRDYDELRKRKCREAP